MPIVVVDLDMRDVPERGGISVDDNGVVVRFGKAVRQISLHLPSAASARLYNAPGNGHIVTAGDSNGPLTKPTSPTSHANLEAAFNHINPGETRNINKDNAQFNCLELKCATGESVSDVRIEVE